MKQKYNQNTLKYTSNKKSYKYQCSSTLNSINAKFVLVFHRRVGGYRE